MKRIAINKWIGGRVIKTGLAAFLTALICNIFNLPALFAVITAIVTIEPTASDSIKKGMIRFPAAMIGAGFAMLFESFLGQSSLAYALAATMTLAVCHKLRLDAGMLVATLTAVAMIAETEDQFLNSFFLRLCTTLIGLVVSTIINFVILPPHFNEMIIKNVDQLYLDSGELLKEFIEGKDKKGLKLEYQRLSKELERTFSLTQYQREEWKYRRHNLKDIQQFGIVVKKLEYFQKILYHFGNLLYLNIEKVKLPTEQSRIIRDSAYAIAAILQDPAHKTNEKHNDLIEMLETLFLSEKERRDEVEITHQRRHISKRLTIIYELLALEDVLEDLERISKRK